MKEDNPIEPNNTPRESKSLTTTRLLIISLAIYFVLFVIVVFQVELGISDSTVMLFIPITIITALTFNLYGIIEGTKELKKHYNKAVGGIIGNLIPIVLGIIFALYLMVLLPAVRLSD